MEPGDEAQESPWPERPRTSPASWPHVCLTPAPMVMPGTCAWPSFFSMNTALAQSQPKQKSKAISRTTKESFCHQDLPGGSLCLRIMEISPGLQRL